MKREIQSAKVATPAAHYSSATFDGEVCYVAGIVGIDSDGKFAEGIEAQTTQTIANIEALLEEVNLGLEDVMSTTVYLKDLADYRAFDQAYASAFGGNKPARATLRVDMVSPKILVEIQATASSK